MDRLRQDCLNMLSKADHLRRKIGILFLATAVVMVITGFTVLDGKLGKAAYLIYWAVCFGFTFLSASVALLDILIIRAKTREEHKKELLDAFEKKSHDGDT